ncbi:MAG: VanZ family protein [Halanaeroarchaeum sp.]
MQLQWDGARFATMAFGTALIVASLVPASGPAGSAAAVAGPLGGVALDKLVHAAGFLVLSVLALRDVERRRWIIAASVGIVLAGAGIEIAQIGIPGRTFEVADFVADVVGVAAGLALLRWRQYITGT